jgi:exopolyphosphatase / guanosine-5'-triphosphate,3'-diphosphate pyrophosphatase
MMKHMQHGGAAMTYYAVVDLGTNSARLMIAHMEGGSVRSDFKTLRMVRIGEGMVDQRRIVPAAMERTASALKEFVEIADRYHVGRHFFCFGTSAVREALNCDDFLCFIQRECGVEIDVITGEAEATLGFAGCVEGYGGIFDIGGGSTEVMFGSLQDVWFQRSFFIGTVRCHAMFPGGDEASPKAFEAAHHYAEEVFSAIPDAGGIIFTGIGGTATALAAIDLKLTEYAPERVQGHIIPLPRMQELCALLESMTKEQRKTLAGLEDKRADVIVFGAIIALEFMEAASADHIIVSDRDNQEGYLSLKLGLI